MYDTRLNTKMSINPPRKWLRGVEKQPKKLIYEARAPSLRKALFSECQLSTIATAAVAGREKIKRPIQRTTVRSNFPIVISHFFSGAATSTRSSQSALIIILNYTLSYLRAAIARY